MEACGSAHHWARKQHLAFSDLGWLVTVLRNVVDPNLSDVKDVTFAN
jgi:hypothetical protein